MAQVEGRTVECEVLVAADPETVWGLVTDIGLPARLSPELNTVEWLDGATAPALGARFAGFNRHSAVGDWRTVSQIVELTAPNAFAWAVMDADGRFGAPSEDPEKPLATWRFTLTPAEGGTLLRHSVRIGPGNSGLSVTVDRLPDKAERVVEIRLGELRTGMEATLTGIKALAERRS
ncbi:SRPBCC family protein [Streptomyces sp. URMC 123]|uniref:SRPBCC family protein n=1 Tax=Streptomyces sp. URMC 123 TaxID=3423403 RepID=UPI003F1AEB6E